MFIRAVDEGLEKLVRARLPLPEDLGDVAYEPPTGDWSAQLSRITVNFFLYQVSRSTSPSRTAMSRTVDGKREHRAPQPLIDLHYLVTAWAGSTREEHQLLGDLASILLGRTTIPDEFISASVAAPVALAFDSDEGNKSRELWSAVSGKLKAGFQLRATVPADTHSWTEAAPPVRRIEAMAAPMPQAAD